MNLESKEGILGVLFFMGTGNYFFSVYILISLPFI
jgi:hypothetical protein